jgi:uncharacterized membrane protein YjjP (DUF1212 family)
MNSSDRFLLKHQELEQIALATLQVARLLMVSGARAEVVHEGSAMVALGLGAEHAELRSGYASLAITVGAGINTITRMAAVGPPGVNHRLDQAVRGLARRVQKSGLTAAAVVAELASLERNTPKHPPWLVAVAVGVACAAFGRLIGVDWQAFLPVIVAVAGGQAIRHGLLQRGANVFVTSAIVAFLSSSFCGLTAKWSGSATIDSAMVASVLLLVPGVPALNSQSDIMEGHPTLGTARAVSVVMILMFIAVGVLNARAVLGIGP